jgi:hypothetical protein
MVRTLTREADRHLQDMSGTARCMVYAGGCKTHVYTAFIAACTACRANSNRGAPHGSLCMAWPGHCQARAAPLKSAPQVTMRVWDSDSYLAPHTYPHTQGVQANSWRGWQQQTICTSTQLHHSNGSKQDADETRVHVGPNKHRLVVTTAASQADGKEQCPTCTRHCQSDTRRWYTTRTAQGRGMHAHHMPCCSRQATSACPGAECSNQQPAATAQNLAGKHVNLFHGDPWDASCKHNRNAEPHAEGQLQQPQRLTVQDAEASNCKWM